MASFSLIILSAFFHTSWNLLVKVSKDKLAYSVNIQIVAAVLFTIIMIIFFPQDLYYDKPTLIFAFISSFFFSLYQILVAAAYKNADVSMVYPITTSSPLFIVFWAYFFLGENISIKGFIGILLVVSGCYIMNITRGTTKTAANGIIFALLAALSYSFGAMADKLGVSSVNTVLYINMMLVFMASFSWLITRFIHKKADAAKFEWKIVLIGGLAIMLSTLTYRLGLAGMAVSYATSLRQVSAIFGVALGIFFFKESYGLKRMVGAAVIFAGIVLIRLGM